MNRNALLLLMVTLPSTALAEPIAPQPGKQIATSVEVPSKADPTQALRVPFLLYAPAEYTSDGKKWPLVLFLHGLGESGDGTAEQIERVAIHGPPHHAKAGRKLPFVLVSPQCPRPPSRDEIPEAWRPELLLPLLVRAEEDLNIDPRRIYVTGLSMGGFGTWRLAAAAPERFAAAAPICGGGNPQAMATALTKLPIWAFHGADDRVVPASRSKQMVEAIRTGGDVRLTIYPKVGHDSWSTTYDNPMFYDWLLGERREE